MRLTALVDSPGHVCCRYRLAALRPYLEESGHSLALRSLPRHFWQWFRLGRELRDTDAVILRRKLLQPWQLALLRRAAGRLIFDFDDAVFLRDSYAAKGFQSQRRQRRFAAMVSASDLVIAGNAFLAEQAAAHAPGRVQVVPTCVEPARYPRAVHRGTDWVTRYILQTNGDAQSGTAGSFDDHSDPRSSSVVTRSDFRPSCTSRYRRLPAHLAAYSRSRSARSRGTTG